MPLDVVALVTAVLGTSSPVELHDLVDTMPELLSDEVGAALRAVAEHAAAEGERDLSEHAGVLADLLRRCRLVGPDEAFAEAAGGGTGVEEAWAAAVEARDRGDADATEHGWRRLLTLLPAQVRRPVPLARLDALSALGALLMARYADHEREPDLDETVAVFGAAAVEAEPGDAADHLANLAAGLMARHDLHGDATDVDRAVAAFESALREPGCRAGARSGLGAALLARHTTTGHRPDVDAAIEHLDAAVAADEEPDGEHLTNLGLGLSARYEATGMRDDLDRAVRVLRDGTDTLPAGSPQRSRATADLAYTLLLVYLVDGDASTLDDAVTTATEAVDHGAIVDLPGFRNTLSACLVARFERTGELDQLDAAVAAVHRAVDDTPATAPERAIYLDGLAGNLRDRYVWRGEVGDVRAAVAAAEEAVAATGVTDTERPRRLTTLANCLATDPAAGPATAERVVACCHEALELCPTEAPDRWLYTFDLAVTLLDRYESGHDREDLDAAVDGFRAALTLAPADLPQGAALHYDLAVALSSRHAAGGGDATGKRRNGRSARPACSEPSASPTSPSWRVGSWACDGRARRGGRRPPTRTGRP
jgi:tetratricopeptide (TPR) repeat protein